MKMTPHEFINLLISRAGLSKEMIEKGRDDLRFINVMQAMEQIHKGKEVLYGNYLETHGRDPELFALMEHFADLKRKYIRAETFIKKRADGDDIPLLELLDTYMDMSVYAAMGVDLIRHLMERVEPKVDDRPGGFDGPTGAD